jgi:hypothetical protein
MQKKVEGRRGSERVLERVYLGEPQRAKRAEDIKNMKIEVTEKELAKAGYMHKPEDVNSISIEELLCAIGEMSRKMDANLKRRRGPQWCKF